jgi:hypothetical protein
MTRALLTKTKYPNVFATSTGGHLVRARVTDPSTDTLVEIKKTIDTTDPLEALQWLQVEIERIKSGVALPQPAKLRFSEFAAQLLDDKVAVGDIKSAVGRSRWANTLEHLIAGTTGEKSDKYVPAFGDIFIDKLHVSHVEAWKLGIAALIKAGDYSPTTANGWLSILRVICKAARRKFNLASVVDLVTRSISGHSTPAMQAHYSTVSPAEQRAGIGKLIQLFGAGGPRNSACGPPSGPPTPGGGPPNEKTG